MRMRIAYCTNVRLPSERAHGHQIAQVCDALSTLGHNVHIFAPYRCNIIVEDYWTYYDSRREVELHHLGSFDPIASLWTPGVIGLFALNALLRRALPSALETHGPFDLLYTRSPALLPTMLATRIPVIFELHQLPRRSRAAFVSACNRCRGVACLTSAMRDALTRWGVESSRLMVEGDAVDLKRFDGLPKVEDARSHLCSMVNLQFTIFNQFTISKNQIIVGYVGRLKTLGMEKGVSIMLQALAKLRSTKKFFGLIVGGPSEDCRDYKREAEQLGLRSDDIHFTGEIPAREVPIALAACDILAMPFPDFPHYRLHMSPLKMFEYMAADKPIITSDLPTVRDVLDERSAIFCEPGDHESFVDALRWIAEHPDDARARAAHARELVKKHTWEERMKRILHYTRIP